MVDAPMMIQPVWSNSSAEKIGEKSQIDLKMLKSRFNCLARVSTKQRWRVFKRKNMHLYILWMFGQKIHMKFLSMFFKHNKHTHFLAASPRYCLSSFATCNTAQVSILKR